MLSDVLTLAFREEATELHIQANLPVTFFYSGELCPTEFWPESVEETDRMVLELLGEKACGHLRARGWAEASGDHPAGRYRVNAYQERGALGARIRLYPHWIVRRGVVLPDVAEELVKSPSGLVLVAGLPGSGVTTTLAGLSMLACAKGRTVTSVEQPQEYLLPGVRQVESLFALRTDSSEMFVLSDVESDESKELALDLVEQGRLVVAGLISSGSVRGIRHYLEGLFEQKRVVTARRLGANLVAALGCCLLDTERGPLLLHEVLRGTPVVRSLISEEKWFRLDHIMRTGGREGMNTLEQVLANGVFHGNFSVDTALGATPNPHHLMTLLREQGSAGGE